MTQEELLELISEVQIHQSKLDDIEVKSANKGTPQRLYEPISAFANSTSGGVILFGLDEERNYEIVGVLRLRDTSHISFSGFAKHQSVRTNLFTRFRVET